MQNFLKDRLDGIKGFLSLRYPLLAILLCAAAAAGVVLLKSVQTVKIFDGENIYIVKTVSGDTDTAINMAGFKNGKYKVLYSCKSGKTTEVELVRTFPVYINVGDKKIAVYTTRSTVGDVLKTAGYSLDEYDMVYPSPETVVKGSMNIDYTNIDYVTGSYAEEIPFRAVTVYSDEVDTGTILSQSGSIGWKEIVSTKKLVNGVEAETRIESEEVIADAIDAVTTVGIRVQAMSADCEDGEALVSGHIYTSYLTKDGGVYRNPYTGLRETYYSQKVLPGGGLKIPGRHVNAEGFVCDGDGYICVASSEIAKGTVIETSRGIGKVYDAGCAKGTLDLYVNW